MDDLLELIAEHPKGIAPAELERRFNGSRATLNRRLREEVEKKTITTIGKGPATRYFSADPMAAIRSYFEKPHTERKVARYREELLAPAPVISSETMESLGRLPRYDADKRELTRFLIDFSCASSVLEGGTYSLLDTQALIEYGEKSPGKPLEDAFLVLNHKEAFEALYDDMRLETIFRVHDLLTSDHDLEELADSRHFLRKQYRGVVREYEDVDIAQSTYQPPFRPGTGYLTRTLNQVLEQAGKIENPVQAAFYLMTRIPYLQPFKDGNKRTSRAICNVPLIKAGLPPISFVDFGKRDYIVSMLAFYELGDTSLAEQCFTNAYVKSIERLGLGATRPTLKDKWKALPATGTHKGEIMAIEDHEVIQNVGRGNYVVWDAERLSGAQFNVGEIVTIEQSGKVRFSRGQANTGISR